MVAGPAVPLALGRSGDALPPRVGRAVARMAADLGAEARPAPSRPPLPTLVLGMPDWRTLTGLETVLGPADVVAEPRGPVAPEVDLPPGGFDVGVALRWLSRLDDPDAGLVALRVVAPRHLLLAGPREPFDPIGARLPTRLLGRGRTGTRWSGSGFLRLVGCAPADPPRDRPGNRDPLPGSSSHPLRGSARVGDGRGRGPPG